MQWFKKQPQDASSSRSLSDAEYCRRLRSGDQDAFLQLYDLYGPTIYRFLLHMTGSVPTSEELTQEVFVTILTAMRSSQALQTFDPAQGTLEGYLLGIARNLARGEFRKQARLVGLDTLVETMEWGRVLEGTTSASGTMDLQEALVLRSELERLHTLILDLPENYRAVIVLCGIQQKSYSVAAKVLECSEGTVASRLYRAKALLAQKLDVRRAREGGRFARSA